MDQSASLKLIDTQDNQIEDGAMEGHAACMGETIDEYNIFVRKSEGIKPLRRTTKDNIKTDDKKMGVKA
jgi:hypothetical protein